MKTIRVEVGLSTPLALGRTHFTLDAVLFGILSDMVERGQTSADPIADIPLRSENGLFYATAAEFSNVLETSETKIGGIRPVQDMADAVRFLKPKGKTLAKIVTTRGDTKAHLSRMRSIACSSVVWEAVGDPEKVEALLRRTPNIGALRKDGHGEVAFVEVSETGYERDEEVLIRNGLPRRPIPVASSYRLNVPTVVETWCPAYWDRANAAECYGMPTI